MAKSPIDLDTLCARLSELGLVILGRFAIAKHHCAPGRVRLAGHEAILIGNAGPAMWEVYTKSSEHADGAPDPMNRWTRARIDPLSSDLEGTAIYPFDKPFWPFQQFAAAATGMGQSPLGLLIHPKYGLWQACRAAIIFQQQKKFILEYKGLDQEADNLIHPCETCLEKPCLAACPVAAFNGSSLNVSSCFSHLDSGAEPGCMNLGCRARAACPVGGEYHYIAEQLQFHMRHYRS